MFPTSHRIDLCRVPWLLVESIERLHVNTEHPPSMRTHWMLIVESSHWHYPLAYIKLFHLVPSDTCSIACDGDGDGSGGASHFAYTSSIDMLELIYFMR